MGSFSLYFTAWLVSDLTARALFMLQEIVNVCAAILANIAEDTEAICGSIEDPNLTSLRVQTTGEWALAESVSRSLMGCDQEEHISMALFRALQSCLSTVISAPHLESEKVSRTQKQLLDTFHLGDGAVLAILCRILRGSPPDRLLHLVLMATSRIFASAQGVAVSQVGVTMAFKMSFPGAHRPSFVCTLAVCATDYCNLRPSIS
jgi:hypothetical protein